ncbi:hypothetical protein CFI11_08580 [Thalassococcus sp. S3]|nr:hypothetical protein CFI11_08580 [Thalassococcus sp. S3]
MEVLCRLAGLLGLATYLLGFAALQMRLICGNGAMFSILNILAATLVLIGLSVDFNLTSALIQISWIAIGLSGLAVQYRLRKRT